MLHRLGNILVYRRGHDGFESCSGRNIFQALISELLKLCITAMISHVFISFSAVQIQGLSHIYLQTPLFQLSPQMGYVLGKSAPSLLRMNYERYLYPYDIFQAGAFTGEPPPLVRQNHAYVSLCSNRNSEQQYIKHETLCLTKHLGES